MKVIWASDIRKSISEELAFIKSGFLNLADFLIFLAFILLVPLKSLTSLEVESVFLGKLL